MVGEPNDMTSKSTANCNWTYFKAKGSYLTLKVYGNCNVTVTGGSTAAENFRGVFIFKEDGTAVDSITASNTALTSVTFTASALETFYIVGNAGGVTEIKCIDSSVDPYDASISDSDLTVRAAATTVYAGNSTIVTATLSDSLNVNTSEISYQWTLESGSNYATLSNATSATATVAVNSDATADQTVTAKCVVTYTHAFNGSTSNSTATKTVNITTATTAVAKTVNATWTQSDSELLYYYDSSEYTSTRATLNDKTASSNVYFKPTTTNSDGSANATLAIGDIGMVRVKNGSTSYGPGTGKTSGSDKLDFTSKTSLDGGSIPYLVLTVDGNCEVVIKGGSQEKATFRGVWAFKEDGTLLTSISSVDAYTETTAESFTASTGEKIYIYVNSGYVSSVTCTATE